MKTKSIHRQDNSEYGLPDGICHPNRGPAKRLTTDDAAATCGNCKRIIAARKAVKRNDMPTKTIEISTATGPLVVPDNEEARAYFRQDQQTQEWWYYPCGGGTLHHLRLCCPMPKSTRIEPAAVAAELWVREGERLCPWGDTCACRECSNYADCDISADEMGQRFITTDNANAARAWGMQGEKDDG